LVECLHINKLDNFTTASRDGIKVGEGVNFTEKALDVAVRPGKATMSQWEQISNAIKYAQDNDIPFNLHFIK